MIETPTPELNAESETDELEVVADESTLDLEGAVKALAKVRKEAASYRTKYRDAETEAARLATEREGLVTNHRTLLVENVALAYGLPEELAAVLAGNDRAELETHASKLAQYAPSGGLQFDPELGGGLNPSGDPDGTYDPQRRAQELRAQRATGRGR